MDKELIVCKALLATLTELTITPKEMRILLALRVYGELRMSELIVRAGLDTPRPVLIAKLVHMRLIDKALHLANQTRDQGSRKVHKYTINPNGRIALKKAIRPCIK